MKKIIYTLFVLIGLSSFGFAQEANEIAQTGSKTEIVNSKVSGVYQFTLAHQTPEGIEKSAEYYTNYFSVAFDEASKVATITMVTNDEKSRPVIIRFLTSAGIRYINMDGTVISNNEFMVEYLK
jgi:capsule polysaccharide export protein KpsE/RkpR